MELTLFIGAFALPLLAGAPIALCFLISALAYLAATDTPLALSTQLMTDGVKKFTLIAVPLYILAGELMNSSGITRRLFDFAHMAVGHIRGGLGHVNVVASMIFAGISGSSSADAAGLGRVEIKSMMDDGYRREFAAAITAASSTIGPIIPPSIHLVLYGSIAEVGIDYLFLAGVVPGIIMGLCLMSAVYLMVVTGRENCPVQPWAGFHKIGRAFVRAFLPLTAPLVIVGGILSGIFTPTEAGVIAVVYVVLLGLLIGEMSWAQFLDAMRRTVRSSSVVLLILATAQAFAWAITIERVPDIVAETMFGLSSDPTIVLLIILVALLILGLFESASANLVIVTPILVPLAPALGIDPVHLGVIIVLALTIGVITPPVGMSLFIVSEITKLPINKVVRALWPYTIALAIALLIVAYIPELSLWLPELYGYAP